MGESEFCSFVILWFFTSFGLISMLLYEELYWYLSRNYCKTVDVFLVLGGATNFYWGAEPICCMKNLIFHLKKGYSVGYWEEGSPCVPSVTTGLYYSTQSYSKFFRKNFTENEVLLIILSVMLSTNFPILTFLWCWLILLWFQVKIRLGKGICLTSFSLGKAIDSHWFKMSCLTCLVLSCVYCFFLKRWNYIKIFSAWISRTSAEFFLTDWRHRCLKNTIDL